MARLPDVSALGAPPVIRSGFQATQYSAGSEGKGMEALGGAMGKLSQTLGYIDQQQKDADTKLQLAYADASFLKSQLDIEDEVAKSSKYDTMEADYEKKVKEGLKTSIDLIQNEGARRLFEAKAASDIERGRARIKDKAFVAAKDVSLAGLQQQADDAQARAATLPEEEARRAQDALTFSTIANRDKKYLTHSQAYDFVKKTDEGFAVIQFNKLSPDERINRLTAYMGGKQDTPQDTGKMIDYIIDNLEGASDKVAIDNNGARAIYGINEKWNPEAFANGHIPTREEAKKIYEEKYYKGNGIDKLPANMQLVALDSVIQHGKGAKLIEEANGDPQKLIELRRDYIKTLPDYEKIGKGLDARLDKLAANTLPKKNTLESMLPQDKLGAFLTNAQSDKAAQKKQIEQDLIDKREADITTKINNESKLMEEIGTNKITAVEMTTKINELDLKGQIRDTFAEEARRYVSSVEKLSAVTDPIAETELIQRVYDVAALADDGAIKGQKDFLEGLSNIQQEIMKKRSDGKLSAESESKLNKQIATITSAKKSEAAKQISSSFGTARGVIDRNLPPEYRLQALRDLNSYSLGSEMSEIIKGKTKAEIKEIYSRKANDIVDSIKKNRRDSAIESVGKVLSGSPKDGMIVKNAKTGERMQFIGGKWQKI